ncbi:SDR family oxidoreductase [Polynucleobacter sp. MWH-UH25E]|uniref:SDR family oxidoreductase n=1 Tax=Polynucleobacter sp. MWH-UH25E TaxID=1855616 RepID=UPI001BFE7915|nr:SDR family oxidoreductase [Polynucleobacter sp. MWH-UH25E]QWD62356.1 SDR family oxidoreductase [Polynucleobacter sp. MWH-UH25E]
MNDPYYKKFNLNGKTALITGSAGLLGAEHAAALLEVGARVILTDVNRENLEETTQLLFKKFSRKQIITKVMDVTSPEAIISVAKNLWGDGLRIDILINNAAIDPKVKESIALLETSRLENFSLEQWNLEIAVGLNGAFLCSKIFGSAMAEDGRGGVILNIASDLSVFSPDQRLYRKDDLPENMQPVKPVTYSVIKTGLIGLTRYLATYWAEQNVRCNALSPGGVFNGQSEVFVRRLSSLIPLGRMAQKDEYCSAIQFLCSDASKYMNGQNIVMDGGRSVW